MNKIIKSIRFDNELVDIINAYIDLENEVHKTNVNFSDFITLATTNYLSSVALGHSYSPFDENTRYIDQKGKITQIALTDEQRTKANDIINEILGYCYTDN